MEKMMVKMIDADLQLIPNVHLVSQFKLLCASAASKLKSIFSESNVNTGQGECGKQRRRKYRRDAQIH